MSDRNIQVLNIEEGKYSFYISEYKNESGYVPIMTITNGKMTSNYGIWKTEFYRDSEIGTFLHVRCIINESFKKVVLFTSVFKLISVNKKATFRSVSVLANHD